VSVNGAGRDNDTGVTCNALVKVNGTGGDV
jgi:hypothetical protein